MVDRSLLKSLLRMLADLQIYQGTNTLKSLVPALNRILTSQYRGIHTVILVDPSCSAPWFEID